MAAATPSGARTDSATNSPRITADTAIPISGDSIGTPAMPSPPPTAINSGKATGNTHSAAPPSIAAHNPTETIATT